MASQDESEQVLFSRNPITGVIESYTNEGQYLGTIETMGDWITAPKPPPVPEGDGKYDADDLESDIFQIEGMLDGEEWEESSLEIYCEELEERYDYHPKAWSKKAFRKLLEDLKAKLSRCPP